MSAMMETRSKVGSLSRRSFVRLGAAGSVAAAAALFGDAAVSDAGEGGTTGAYDGILPEHAPLGRGVGAAPGRVAWAHDPAAVAWDGSGRWWDPSGYNEGRVLAMVRAAVASTGGADDAPAGWSALFAALNASRGVEGGYAAGQRVAIKCNMNGSGTFDDDTDGETSMSFTNPVLLRSLLASLVEDAGVPADAVTVYDASRIFPTAMVELCTQGGLGGVRFVGRDAVEPDEGAPIAWSLAFDGPDCYLPTCVTEADYLVNLASLKGHSYGITLCGKNHFGSFYNGDTLRPPQTAGLHRFVSSPEMGAYSPLVDFMVDPRLGGKTVLYLLDALVCATSEGASVTREAALWQQPPFDGGFTASVFASQDPVAIDSVGVDFLTNEPAVTGANARAGRPGVEGYLHEAAQVAAASGGVAPSGVAYGSAMGLAPENLGVHEHWNNVSEKLYSRNSGESEGIELVYLPADA